jgi:thymidylate synthase (FAD)
MSVKLISASPAAERGILYIARVSSDQENEDTKLLGYLIRNQHWSPFEHAHMTLEIVTSRAIATQIIRHRSFTFQEFSQRYSIPPNAVIYKGRRQAEKNRQSSVDDLSDEIQNWWLDAQAEVARYTQEVYEYARGVGIAKECARFVLPLSTETKLYMTGSLRSWIHYFALRCDEYTQLEHRELAFEAREIFIELFPIISKALGYARTKV